jgi:hypothetical protein
MPTPASARLISGAASDPSAPGGIPAPPFAAPSTGADSAPDEPIALFARSGRCPAAPDSPGSLGREPRPAPTPAPAAPIAASAINPATGALSAPVAFATEPNAFPTEPNRDADSVEGSGSGASRGATDSSIDTGYGLLACVAMGLR